MDLLITEEIGEMCVYLAWILARAEEQSDFNQKKSEEENSSRNGNHYCAIL
jgi:hypothetical protein